MKRSILVGLALATALAAAPVVKADTTIFFYLGGSAVTDESNPNCCAPSITGGGFLSGTALGGGSYDITGTALSGVTFNIGGDVYSASVIPDASSPTPIYYPYGSDATTEDFQFDDVLALGTSPIIDEYGLLFSISGAGSYNGAVITFYTDGPNGSPSVIWWDLHLTGAPDYGWPIGANNGGLGDPLDYFYVPEPSSFLLLVTGLLGLAAFLYRSRQTEQRRAA